MMNLHTKFRRIADELRGQFLERDEETIGLMIALVARQHVLFLGPPGTGKSALTRELCQRIDGAAFFEKLLAKTTTPDELWGPPSLKGLENDEFRRVTTGMALEAHIWFPDEIWKANSAVLNDMLGALNERQYKNGAQMLQIPLEICVGASNELPEDMESLGALWDRFMLRYVVDYIRDPRNFEAMMLGQQPAGRTTINLDELKQAQAEAAQVDIAKVLPTIWALKKQLEAKNIRPSDRRWKQSLGLIKAAAWLDGRKVAGDDDLGILAPALWLDPGQRNEIRAMIMQTANPIDTEAMTLKDEALEIYNAAMAAPEEKQAAAGTDANTKLKRIQNKLIELTKQAQAKGRSDDRPAEAMKNVLLWNEEVVNVCLLGKPKAAR